MLIHIKDTLLGEFDYEDTYYTMKNDEKRSYLHFNDNLPDEEIKIPNGLKNCYKLFENCKIKKAPEIPYGVVDTSYMFFECKYLETLSYIPSSVEYCNNMCEHCCSLTHVENIPISSLSCKSMFEACRALKVVPNFDINPDCNYSFMFKNCDIRKFNPYFFKAKLRTIVDVYSGCTQIELPYKRKNGKSRMNLHKYTFVICFFSRAVAPIQTLEYLNNNMIINEYDEDEAYDEIQTIEDYFADRAKLNRSFGRGSRW